MKTIAKGKVTFSEYNPAEYIEDIEDKETIIAHLRVALEKNDPDFLLRTIGDIARYERLTQKSLHSQKPDEIDFGWLRINNTTHRVFANDVEVSLTLKEYELLYFLASNPEAVFSKETLYDRIWGEDMYGDLKTVKVHISRLREKIERNPAEPVHIETVWGAGYRLVK